ncbi:hypothetical protein MTP99_016806 [Tenebrio molitor]|nr:hypothetical protein MTP99_016806 [Tenebrio molitor]
MFLRVSHKARKEITQLVCTTHPVQSPIYEPTARSAVSIIADLYFGALKLLRIKFIYGQLRSTVRTLAGVPGGSTVTSPERRAGERWQHSRGAVTDLFASTRPLFSSLAGEFAISPHP